MPKDYNYSKTHTKDDKGRHLWPRPVVGEAAMMAEAQGISPWVGSPTAPYGFQTCAPPPKEPGAANRIPPEIAAQISKYLDVKDLGRAAIAWRSVALASYASPEYIKLECGKYSLLTTGASTWRPDVMRSVRERMEQYNYAWSTLQYTGSQSFSIPHTTGDTPWAGSDGWRSGNRFTGESNGYIYDVSCREALGQMQARVCLHQLPSFRTGETGLKMSQFDVVLSSHFVRAVTVDPVGQVVGILEYNNNNTHDVYSRIPVLHVYNLNGRRMGSVQIRIGFPTLTEIYHMELHGEMVCIIANYSDTDHSLIGVASSIVIQSWVGEPRCVSIKSCLGNYCTGFQFITEDLWILTEKGKEDRRDKCPSALIRVGHVRMNIQRPVTLADIYGKGWTPNTVSLIRNVSPYSPVSGIFYPNPAVRLFGIKWEYVDYIGKISANSCLFSRSQVEAWLGIAPSSPPELHWISMPFLNDADPRKENGGHSPPTDFSNRQGFAVIGRRLFWAEIWPNGWSLNLLDYNPGAGNAICMKVEARGEAWKSYTCYFCSDPYPVAYSASSRISDLARIIPTEDGLLLKQNNRHGPAYTMLL
ncbi:hypothetical protein C8R47DRAFT_1131026, partial [Mycena vitilis]